MISWDDGFPDFANPKDLGGVLVAEQVHSFVEQTLLDIENDPVCILVESQKLLRSERKVGLSPPMWHWAGHLPPKNSESCDRPVSKLSRLTHYHRACLRLKSAWTSQWLK